jgi:hypothetical protein
MRLALLAAAALFPAVPALAQGQPSAPPPGAAGPVEPRVNQLIIYGDDPCPPSTDDEINVCARLPEGDRYRIPENLRHDPNDARNGSWANRAIELSYVGRTGTDSCSTVGGGGFTGCMMQMINAARAERANSDQVNWNALIEEAREQRLGTIDQRARDAEENEHPNSRVIYNSGDDSGPQ